jgi:hypothetical protein
MKHDKGKAQEPYNPDQTPEPPQRKNPGIGPEDKLPKNTDDKKQPKDSGKRLGESPSEIDDETTI